MSRGATAQPTGRRRPGRPRTLPIDEQRRIVLEAARRVFAANDFHGSTIDAVAKEAGVARSLVYELFTNKQQLFVAVVDAAVEELIAEFTEDVELRRTLAQLSLRERIRQRVTRLFEFIHDRGDAATIVRIAEFGGVGPAKADIVSGRMRIEDGLAVVYQETWADIAPISRDAARLLALATLSMVEAVGFRQPSEPNWDAEATIDLVTEMLLGALLQLGTHSEPLRSFGEPQDAGTNRD